MDLITKEFFMGGGVNPKSFAGLQLWFDASDGSTITQSAGAVSQWNDKSGNANNLTQATGSAQPTIQAAAQNGRNTLLFNSGASQQMNLANSVANGSFSEFIVFKATTSGFVFVPAGNRNTNGGCTGVVGGVGELFVISNDGNFVHTAATFTDTTSYHLIDGISDGIDTDSLVFFDRVSQALSGASGVTLSTFNGFGATNQSGFMNGAVAEYVRYNVALNSAQRQGLENYLRNKWATP